MSWIKDKSLLKALRIAALPLALLLLAQLFGCGMRSSNTGGICGRVLDANSSVVAGATVVSLFDENQKVYTDLSGFFKIDELPAGLHTLAIAHKDFDLEQVSAEIKMGKMTDVGEIKLSNVEASDKLSEVLVASVASSSATITFKTNRERVCTVIYGLENGGYTHEKREFRAGLEHSIVLTQLEPETLYHFRVRFEDETGKTYNSYDYSFVTAAPDRPMKPNLVNIEPLVNLKTVTVSWVAPTNNRSVAGYNIYRRNKLVKRTEMSDWVRLNDDVLDAKTLSYSDTSVESGMFYRYALVSVNQYGAESEKEISSFVFTTGIINSDTILTAEDSPVELYSDLIVSAGVNLTIEPGVEVLVANRDSFASGLDETRIEILVYGQITFVGEQAKPIVFAPLNGDGRRDHWAGIKILTDSQLISQLSHVHLFGCNDFALNANLQNLAANNISVSYSKKGLRFENLITLLELDNCLLLDIAEEALSFKECNRVRVTNSLIKGARLGLTAENSHYSKQFTIRNTDFYVQEVGIQGSFGQGSILNTLIVAKNGKGIVCNDALNSAGNYIDHNTIDAREGIEINSGSFVITNNIITNTLEMGARGIINNTGNELNNNYNNLNGFDEPYVLCEKGNGSTSLVPRFFGGNPYDYSLNPTSILIFSDEYQKEVGRYGVTRY
jgi:hypothetical protein